MQTVSAEKKLKELGTHALLTGLMEMNWMACG